jgi:hypothetical protein
MHPLSILRNYPLNDNYKKTHCCMNLTVIFNHTIHKQDRKHTYTGKIRRFRVTIAAVEKQYYAFWVFVFSLSYPACKPHAPCYFAIYSLSSSTMFLPRYLIKGTIFGGGGGGMVESKMCNMIFSTEFGWNISHCKKNLERECHNVPRS